MDEACRHCEFIYTPKEMGDKSARIYGSYISFIIIFISKNGTPPSSIAEQANVLGDYFERVCSSAHYCDTFLRRQLQAMRHPINVPGGAQKIYNTL